MVHRRRLRSELRKVREQAGYTQRDVARAMDWSMSKLIRIEAGAVNITTNDLKVLLSHYGVTDPDRVNHLLGVARAARDRSPWTVYRELISGEFLAFLAYESAASVVRSYEPLFVPGLLQVEEYAREVLAGEPGRTTETIERLLELRMERQDLLSQENRPELHFVIDEAVINRPIGGPGVMRRQLQRIREVSAQDGMTIHIVPYAAGMYLRLGTPFVLFEFSDPLDEDVLFVENPVGDMIVREAQPDSAHAVEVAGYLEAFFHLEQLGTQEDVLDYIDSALSRTV
jgi:transcriptional regulator with XRE-family HTH domain